MGTPVATPSISREQPAVARASCAASSSPRIPGPVRPAAGLANPAVGVAILAPMASAALGPATDPLFAPRAARPARPAVRALGARTGPRAWAPQAEREPAAHAAEPASPAAVARAVD